MFIVQLGFFMILVFINFIFKKYYLSVLLNDILSCLITSHCIYFQNDCWCIIIKYISHLNNVDFFKKFKILKSTKNIKN